MRKTSATTSPLKNKLRAVGLVLAIITTISASIYAIHHLADSSTLFTTHEAYALAPVPVATWDQLQQAITDAGTTPTTIQLTADIPSFATLLITSGADITLTGPHSLIANGNFPAITVQGTFTLDGLLITRQPSAPNANSRGVLVNSGGHLIFLSGQISGHAATSGGGINNNGTVTMKGGIISNNTVPGSGGGVNNNGTFTMTGGSIENHTTTGHAAGVHNSAGATFNLDGGHIVNNHANANGAGVFNNGTFNMTAGSISHNTSNHGMSAWGGTGVRVNQGTFTMSGGEISHNTAFNGHGGGVESSGTFIMTGGYITQNHAHGNAGGIGAAGNTFLTSDVISHNTATQQGGGISTNSPLVIGAGMRIEYNTALLGGGIRTGNPSALNISESAIFRGNSASSTHDYGLPAGLASFPNIRWAGYTTGSNSIIGTHLLNNFDINFTGNLITAHTATFKKDAPTILR